MKRRRDSSRGAVPLRSGPTVLDAARAAGLVPDESPAVAGPDAPPAAKPGRPSRAPVAAEGADAVTPAIGLAAVATVGARASRAAAAGRAADIRDAEDDDAAMDPAPAEPAPAGPRLPPRPDARPRIVDDTGILGLSRVSRGRVGSRLFTWFFVFVFALIAVQMVVALLTS